MGRKPPRTTTYRPTPTAPIIYQSVIPEEDFKRAGDYVSELKAERAAKRKKMEDAGFGSSDMKKRQEQYMKAEQDMYKASLPKKPPGSPGATP